MRKSKGDERDKEVVFKEDKREEGKRKSYGKEGKVSGRHL